MVIDVRHLHQPLGQVERRALAVQEAGEPTTPQERHGLEGADRRIHRVEAARVQLEGADRADAGDEEQEASGEVALPLLVLTSQAKSARV